MSSPVMSEARIILHGICLVNTSIATEILSCSRTYVMTTTIGYTLQTTRLQMHASRLRSPRE